MTPPPGGWACVSSGPPPPWTRRRRGVSPTLPAADTRSLALRRGATVWLLWELHHLPQTALPFPEVTAITTPRPVTVTADRSAALTLTGCALSTTHVDALHSPTTPRMWGLLVVLPYRWGKPRPRTSDGWGRFDPRWSGCRDLVSTPSISPSRLAPGVGMSPLHIRGSWGLKKKCPGPTPQTDPAGPGDSSLARPESHLPSHRKPVSIRESGSGGSGWVQ